MESKERNDEGSRQEVGGAGGDGGDVGDGGDGGAGAAGGSKDQVGFWRRVFGGPQGREGERDGASAVAAEAGEDGSALPAERPERQARVRTRGEEPRARRREQTIFDKAEEEQRKRYARAAMARRERLAGAIGDRVEQLLEERMETGEEKLARAAAVFRDMNGLLGSIGSSLDAQTARSERMAQDVARLPELAEQEHEVLHQIAHHLEGHAHAVEGVPEVVSLVREGARASQERLAAVHALKDELALQRGQRDRVLELLHSNASRFEERMGSLEEVISTSALQARTDALALRRSIEQSVGRLAEQQREELAREDQRSAAVQGGIRKMAERLEAQNALASVSVAQQGRSIEQFHDAHEELIDLLQRTQTRTVTEMHRLQEEAQEREVQLARRGRMALVGSVGFLAILGAFLFSGSPPAPQIVPIYYPQQASASEPWRAVAPEQAPERAPERASTPGSAPTPGAEPDRRTGDIAPTTTGAAPQAGPGAKTLPASMSKRARDEDAPARD